MTSFSSPGLPTLAQDGSERGNLDGNSDGSNNEFLDLARSFGAGDAGASVDAPAGDTAEGTAGATAAPPPLTIGEAPAADYLAAIRPQLIRAGSLLLPNTQQYPVRLSRSLREMVLENGGKLLRPSLSLITAQLLGGRTDTALAFGWAIELIHNASLILDDLPAMDDATMRRGRMVIHLRHSTAYAILLATYMHNVAMQVIGRRTPSAEVHLQFTLRLQEALGGHGLIGGQALDLDLMEEAPDLEAAHDYGHRNGLRDLWSVCAHFKTASLFSLALYAGAVDAGLSSAQISTLLRCGDSAGLVFQLADDESDLDEDRQRSDFQSLLSREQRLQEAEDRRRQWRQELSEAFGSPGDQLADYLDLATVFPAAPAATL